MEEEAPDSRMAMKNEKSYWRAEIDTSAPIESVKDAAAVIFGGIGYWNPKLHNKVFHADTEDEYENDFADLGDVEEQAAELEKELMLKERETLDVLKELERTRSMVEELKSKLNNEASELNSVVMEESVAEEKDSGNNFGGLIGIPSCAPGLILLELKRAKTSLVKTTSELTELRASVETYAKRIEKEREGLEGTKEGLVANSEKVKCLEKELCDMRRKLEVVRDGGLKDGGGWEVAKEVSKELQRLSKEAAGFKRVGEAAKNEVARAVFDIEMMKAKIRTAEMRLVAAEKVKEAARAGEAVDISEVKMLSGWDNDSRDREVTLSAEEYYSLRAKAKEAEERYDRKIVEAMVQVDDANVSEMEILKRVNEATEEVKSTKMALEEALRRVEVANKGKKELERALRKRKSEQCHRRRSMQKSAKFRSPACPIHRRKEKSYHLRDVNGNGESLNLISEWSEPATRPTMSIGEILSQKLLHPPESQEEGYPSPDENAAPDISLREMLGKNKTENVAAAGSIKAEHESGENQQCANIKTCGLGRFSRLLRTKSNKKKRPLSLKYCTGMTNPHDRISFG